MLYFIKYTLCCLHSVLFCSYTVHQVFSISTTLKKMVSFPCIQTTFIWELVNRLYGCNILFILISCCTLMVTGMVRDTLLYSLCMLHPILSSKICCTLMVTGLVRDTVLQIRCRQFPISSCAKTFEGLPQFSTIEHCYNPTHGR